MIDAKSEAILRIADTHVKNLQAAFDDLQNKFPFTEQFIVNMEKTELRILETMTSRFAKLQDLMGTKIIDLFLLHESQPIEGLSMLDKIHKLEKHNMLDSEDTWIELRNVRNHISHEYPDNPELASKQLNHVYSLAPTLIAVYEKLAKVIRS